jgi:hypothetical protein
LSIVGDILQIVNDFQFTLWRSIHFDLADRRPLSMILSTVMVGEGRQSTSLTASDPVVRPYSAAPPLVG